MRTRVSPSTSSKQACPRKRISIGQSPFSVFDFKFAGQLPADGHAHQHPDAGLLGEHRPDRGHPLVLVGRRRRAAHLLLLLPAEPAAPRGAPCPSMRWSWGAMSRDAPLRLAQPVRLGQRAAQAASSSRLRERHRGRTLAATAA